MIYRILFAIVFIVAAVSSTLGQTTEFSYQGQLESASAPANGSFDFEFVLFDSASGGAQSSPVLPRSNVSVVNGTFSVTLDFGTGGFPGASRYLEIRVRQAGGGSFTTLGPRQVVGGTPYAVKSISANTAESATVAQNALTATNATSAQSAVNAQTAMNALNLGGVAANQFVQTNDSRLTDARPPTAGSSNYIQNAGTAQVPGFNIAGFGTAGNLNSLNNYLINGTRIMSNAGSFNMFVGANSGSANSGSSNAFFGASTGSNNLGGNDNSFFGFGSGFANTLGSSNAFFGRSAGENNTTGNGNSFFGTFTGDNNTTGGSNTYFGASSGRQNTTGSGNSFFGNAAGFRNTSGNNSFFGNRAGEDNTSGSQNSFFGSSAGGQNTTGFGNSYFGSSTGIANTIGENNSFFGTLAGSANTGSRNTFVGGAAGAFNTTGGENTFVGLGAGQSNSTGFSNAFFGTGAGVANTSGQSNTVIGAGANVGSANLSFATALGSGAVVTLSNTVVIGRAADTVRIPGGFAPAGLVTTGGNLVVAGTSLLAGVVDLGTLGAAGSQAICRNASGQISTCSSSLRYKTNFSSYRSGLELINKLKPLTFDWKDGGLHDLGLGAEDVAAIEPLLVTYNTKGEVEGVKYDRIGVVLVNAVKEQQKQIERQDSTIRQQRSELAALKAFVCSRRAKTAFCKK